MSFSNLFIIYASGSPLGNSRKTAESLFNLALEYEFNAQLYDIKEFNETLTLNEVTDPVIFVCSSTGDGEVPDSAAQFWNEIKLKNKNTNKDFLANLNYAILGLGDSRFPKFCGGTKLIHRKFIDLGAHCFYGPFFADDCEGIDVVVDSFKEDIWNAIKYRSLKKNTNETGGNCFLCVLF